MKRLLAAIALVLGGCVSAQQYQEAYQHAVQNTESALHYARNEANQLRAALETAVTNEDAMQLAESLAAVEGDIEQMEGHIASLAESPPPEPSEIGASLLQMLGASAGGTAGVLALIGAYFLRRNRGAKPSG